jgi:hypothetical protein
MCLLWLMMQTITLRYRLRYPGLRRGCLEEINLAVEEIFIVIPIREQELPARADRGGEAVDHQVVQAAEEDRRAPIARAFIEFKGPNRAVAGEFSDVP